MIWKALALGKLNRGLGMVAALAALAALMVAPTAGFAKAPVKFGSKLNPSVQPSNSLPGIGCNEPSPCTMVQEEAYGRSGTPS